MTTTVASAIIQKAYQNAGKIARGATPSSAQLADGLSTLYDVIAFEVTQGLKLWLETETTISLVSGQTTYSIYPSGSVAQVRPLRVKEASYWDSAGTIRPLTQISREEWTRQAGRSGTGSVTQYFVEKLYDRLNFNCWLTPDSTAATGTIRAVLANQATLPVNLTDDCRLPPEWNIFMQWRLGQELATGMPPEIIQRCDQRAEFYRAAIEAFDVEDAPTFFTVDTQGQTGSKFS
jgi:hypothetical protein